VRLRAQWCYCQDDYRALDRPHPREPVYIRASQVKYICKAHLQISIIRQSKELTNFQYLQLSAA